MKKVLHLGVTDNLGGIETFVVSAYRNIDKTKIVFDFGNIYDNLLCFEEEFRNGGATVYQLPNYYKRPFAYIRELKKILLQNNYDAVHCHMNSAVMLWPLIAAKLSGVKVIVAHSHNSSSDKGILKDILHQINKNFIPFFANKYIACSDLAAQYFYSNKIIKSPKFSIINNAIDVEKFLFSNITRKQIREKLNVSEDTFLLGHVGRFTPQKNHLFLVGLFAKFHKKFSKSKLLLIGKGELKETVQKEAEKLGVLSEIIFLENISDVENYYCAMDVFLLPSLYEGLGIVLIEAQVSGLPILTSTNVPTIVNVGTSKFYAINLQNKKEWLDKLTLVHSFDKTEERNINREFVKQRGFDIKEEVKRIMELYAIWDRT
ncbi:TPA: glycosyltransferase [Streptococcus suis]|nr:glycosyltransferase [Streptococcus suis]